MLPPNMPVTDPVVNRIDLFSTKTTTEAGTPPQNQVVNNEGRFGAAVSVNFKLENPADTATVRIWVYDRFRGWGIVKEMDLPGTYNPNYMIPWKDDVMGMSVGVTVSAFTSGGVGGGVSCSVAIFGRHVGGNF